MRKYWMMCSSITYRLYVEFLLYSGPESEMIYQVTSLTYRTISVYGL